MLCKSPCEKDRKKSFRVGESICKPHIQETRNLHARIGKALSKFNSKKKNNPIRKQTEAMNRHFTEEYIQMANKL